MLSALVATSTGTVATRTLPVLQPSAAGRWDSSNVASPVVLLPREGVAGDPWRMFYYGSDGTWSDAAATPYSAITRLVDGVELLLPARSISVKIDKETTPLVETTHIKEVKTPQHFKTPITYLGHHFFGRVPAQPLLARALDQDQQRVGHLVHTTGRLREGLELRDRRLVEAIDGVIRRV